jgi:hypothetical protein
MRLPPSLARFTSKPGTARQGQVGQGRPVPFTVEGGATARKPRVPHHQVGPVRQGTNP